MIMENSSASAFSDEIPNNFITDFPSSPVLPSPCSVYDIPPPPSPLSDYRNLNHASFAGGYMDLLCLDDFSNSWFSDYNFETAATQTDLQLPPVPVLSPAAPSEILNNPATPVSVSVSGSSLNTSSLNEAGAVANKPVVAVAENAENAENEDGVRFVEGKEAGAESEVRDGDRRIEVVENQNDQNQTNEPVKPKKNDKKKKKKHTRVTFKIETQLDHLDDGFRWRKYGQKAVKNSPFPRSYYRCTTWGCGVKKHIERYAPEPWVLLTTYEGNHNHPAPKVARAARLGIMHDAIAVGVQKIDHQIKTNGVGVAGNKFAMSQPQPQQFQNQNQNVIHHQPALSPLSYNNDYNNSKIASTMNVNSSNNSPPLNVVNFSAAHTSPPLNVVDSSAAQNSPTLSVVNSSDAHNSPPFNVVNSANNFIKSSTTFSEFLQNIGGCNFSMLTDNLTSNDGLLQDMIMPKKMRGASVGAGAGAVV